MAARNAQRSAACRAYSENSPAQEFERISALRLNH